MPAKISVMGLYKYDNTLFSGMVLPSAMDKNVMINYILMECSELEVLIPDPDTLKTMIESWSISRLHSWERIYETTVADFNMLHNYDRYEDWTDTGSGTGTGKSSTQLNKAAYNNRAPVITDKNDTDSTTSTTTRGTHNGHLYGNIGVVTSTQMLEEARQMYLFDVFQAITDEFKRKFCVVVY